MRRLSVDIETYSSVDIKKSGLYRYVEAPDFSVLLFAYSLDGQPVQVVDLAQGEQIPRHIISALFDPAVEKRAWNAAFEWYALGRHFSLPHDQLLTWLTQWRCSMVHAYYCGYPGSLAAAGEAVGIPADKKKLSVGGALIRTFCVPCKPTQANGGRTRTLPHHEPEKWDLFKQYCAGDVAAEMAIAEKLDTFPVPEQEWSLWRLDMCINERGVECDRQLVESAIRMLDAETAELVAEAVRLTGIENPKSVQQLTSWLEEETGEEVADLRKGTVAKMVERLEPGKARRVLEIRQELSKSSTKKYAAMRETICGDDRIRGLLQFYGANRTGRWAGRLVQVQNLPRNNLPAIELARTLAARGDAQALKLLYGSLSDTLSQLIRTALIARPHTCLHVADFSAIEARVLAWLAGEQWRIDVFRTHGKIYEASASQMFGVPIEQIGKGSDLRQRGKVAELALGYQGGVGALISMGALDMGLSEDELPEIVERWRNANRAITEFWRSIEGAALHAVQTGEAVGLRGLVIAREMDSRTGQDFLTIRLHSGRKLYYPRPHVVENQFGRPAVHYYGTEGGKWTVLSTYGGKLTENCLASNTLVLTDRGWVPIINVRLSDKVWDGVEWVSHGGLLQQGVKQTVSVDGVRMTPDHLILTEEGWRSASSCEGHYRSAVTLPNRSTICGLRRQKVALGIRVRLRPDSHYAGGRVQEGETEVLRLHAQAADLQQPQNTQHVEASGLCGVALDGRPLPASVAPRLAQLWRPRNPRMPGVGIEFRGFLAGHGPDVQAGAYDREGRRERELRAGKLYLGNAQAASEQQTRKHPHTDAVGRNDGSGSSRPGGYQPNDRLLSNQTRMAGSPLTVQAGCKEPVYDLLNAGPRHRFTVLGDSGPMIVHNCVQAISRDCLANAMMKLNAAGFEIVMHVHDEVVAEVEGDRLEEMLELMREPIPWAPGLPLDAAGFTTDFYMKD